MTAELLTESKPSMPQLPSAAETKIPVQPRPREVTKTGLAKVDIFLLSCGIARRCLYVFTDVLLAMRWDGYSYRDQTISELNAIGAPTRTLSIVLGIVGYAFLVAFGSGRLEISGGQSKIARGCRWADCLRRSRVVRGAVLRDARPRG